MARAGGCCDAESSVKNEGHGNHVPEQRRSATWWSEGGSKDCDDFGATGVCKKIAMRKLPSKGARSMAEMDT